MRSNPLSHRSSFVTSLMVTFAVLVVPLLLGGCNSTPKVSDSDVVFIDHKEMSQQIESQGDKLVIVDPRITAKYAIAHIPHAINIPLPDAREDDPRLTKAKEIIVYGYDYDDPLAKAMSKKLMALRYDNVVMLQGGLTGWISAGMATDPPIETPKKSVTKPGS